MAVKMFWLERLAAGPWSHSIHYALQGAHGVQGRVGNHGDATGDGTGTADAPRHRVNRHDLSHTRQGECRRGVEARHLAADGRAQRILA